MRFLRVVQYIPNRQKQLTNRQTGSRFAATWCCDMKRIPEVKCLRYGVEEVVESSAFNKTRHPPELRRVFCCESPGIFHRVQVKFKQKKKTENSYECIIGLFAIFGWFLSLG